MSDDPGQTGFSGWQWAEIAVVAVLIWAQIITQVVVGQLLLAGLLGLVLFGVLIHIATWIIPLARERKTGTARSLLGHGERPPIVVGGLGVLLLGIMIACGAALDLVARGEHADAPVSALWAIVVLVLGFVLAIVGNLVVQFERIRVRRDAS